MLKRLVLGMTAATVSVLALGGTMAIAVNDPGNSDAAPHVERTMQTPRMVRDVPIPFCEDIDVGGTEKVHTEATTPPVLPGPGVVGNVVCGARPTVTDTPVPYPLPLPSAIPSTQAVTYYYGGYQVANSNTLQVWGGIDVSNPSVPHDGGDDNHFVARFVAKESVAGVGCPDVGGSPLCWIEVGWGEFESQGNNRYVYTHSTDDNTTYTYQTLGLTDGNNYSFSTKYEGGQPSDVGGLRLLAQLLALPS